MERQFGREGDEGASKMKGTKGAMMKTICGSKIDDNFYSRITTSNDKISSPSPWLQHLVSRAMYL